MKKQTLYLAAAALIAATGNLSATSDIVAHYKMGELEVAGGAGEGGTASNLLPTVGSVDMAVSGTPVIQAGGPASALGGSTHYMRFDGVEQRYNITPDLLGAIPTNWLIEAWARPQPGGSGLEMIVAHGDGGRGQVLSYDPVGKKYGWFSGGSGQINGTVGPTGIGTDWDHLALVRENGLTSLYVNGNFAGSNGHAGNGNPNYNDNSGIGSQGAGGANHGFTGDIDEVYFSTVSGFDAATDLHMSNPPDPSITVPDQPVDAGTIVVNTTFDIIVYVDNHGADNALTINSVTGLIGDTDKFVLQTALPLDIAPGGFDTLVFRYTPGAAAGNHEATFTISSNDTSNPAPSVTLTGAAVTDPNIIVASELDFGDAASDSGPHSKLLQVDNTGWDEDLIISAAVVSGDTAYFSVSSVDATIAPGDSGDIEISYDPQGNLGSHSAVLEITHNDPDVASPIQVTLTGNSMPRFTTLAHYKLGENDTDLATTMDDIGSYHLTNINATPGTSYNSGAPDADSSKGIDHTLNDVYSYTGVPAELTGRITNWGMEAWVRPELSTGSSQINGGYGGLSIGVGNGSRGGFSVFSLDGLHWGLNIGGITSPLSVAPIKGGKWTHVAAVAAGNQLRLYVDGVLATTYNGSAYAPNDTGAREAYIEMGGQTENSWRTAGGLDEASIFTFVSGEFDPATDLHVTPSADADGDGLPDVWEDQYFGNNDGIVTWSDLVGTDGTGDADSDGLTDMEEYTLGSDPKDANDPVSQKIVITGTHKTGNTFTVDFTGADGQSYLLKKSLTLQDGFPTEVDSITLGGTNSGSLEDPGATEDKAFYRVESTETIDAQ